jgi:2-oxo-4-hydroxy-4-carboxy--5-ureidoimidazoline (OHCU) decarboxylase
MPLRFHRAASAEAVAARDWYEHARRGLGATFVTEVERMVKLIEQYPSRFPFLY